MHLISLHKTWILASSYADDWDVKHCPDKSRNCWSCWWFLLLFFKKNTALWSSVLSYYHPSCLMLLIIKNQHVGSSIHPTRVNRSSVRVNSSAVSSRLLLPTGEPASTGCTDLMVHSFGQVVTSSITHSVCYGSAGIVLFFAFSFWCHFSLTVQILRF